jgi:hypothetical protein
MARHVRRGERHAQQHTAVRHTKKSMSGLTCIAAVHDEVRTEETGMIRWMRGEASNIHNINAQQDREDTDMSGWVG